MMVHEERHKARGAEEHEGRCRWPRRMERHQVIQRRIDRDGLCLFRAMCQLEGPEGTDAEARRKRLEVVGWVREAWENGEYQVDAAQDWEEAPEQYFQSVELGRKYGGPVEIQEWTKRKGYGVRMYHKQRHRKGKQDRGRIVYHRMSVLGQGEECTWALVWMRVEVGTTR